MICPECKKEFTDGSHVHYHPPDERSNLSAQLVNDFDRFVAKAGMRVVVCIMLDEDKGTDPLAAKLVISSGPRISAEVVKDILKTVGKFSIESF